MRKLIVLFLAAAASASAAVAVPMDVATPESQGVPSRAILAYLDACERELNFELHGVVIVRHGKVIAAGSWRPFDTLNEPHMLYSHSKSFTSTAIGLLADDRRIDLDERVIDIFPDKLPATVPENLRQLRVRDLLTMNVGTKKADYAETCGSDDWERAFFENTFDDPPGTRFQYDSSATYMLAAIAERRSGQKLMDFLRDRFFSRIGIEKAWSTTSPTGVACGGWGMRMTTPELARFALVYLNGGVWDGRRVLSGDWVRMATSKQTRSGWQPEDIPDNDWYMGYGFQFWRCRHNAFRADGAYGQYSIVMPDQDMLVSIHGGVRDMGREMQLVWDHLLAAAAPGPLPEDASAQAALRARLANLAIPAVAGSADGTEAFCGREIALKPNGRGIASVRFDRTADGWSCTLATRAGKPVFPVGCGKWLEGRVAIDPEPYETLGLIGTEPVRSSGAVDATGTFGVRCYLTGTTAYLDFRLSKSAEGKVRLTGEFFAMRGTDLESAD